LEFGACLPRRQAGGLVLQVLLTNAQIVLYVGDYRTITQKSISKYFNEKIICKFGNRNNLKTITGMNPRELRR
jgi:hypothetical protein